MFTDEQIIASSMDYFRRTGFPYRALAVHECMQEINALAATDGAKLRNAVAGTAVADTFHPHRYHAHAHGRKSPFDAWSSDHFLRCALELELNKGRIGSGYPSSLNIVRGTQAAANFRPGFALYLYRRYAPRDAVVLDTSTGFGGRLVGFMASECARYIGIDPSTQTHAGNLAMAAALGFSDRVELICQPAEDVDRETVRGRCDFAFTSPPYWGKEVYCHERNQSRLRYPDPEGWRAGFLAPMLRLQYAALKPGSLSIVNVEDVTIHGRLAPLARWTVDEARAAGFKFLRREAFPLHTRFGSGEQRKGEEGVLIFHKPKEGSNGVP